MKRPYRNINKVMWMKWRLLTFTKGARRGLGRFHSLKKHQSHPNHMNLKKYQSPLMFQVRKNRSLKKHQGQAMEKRSLQRQKKKLKRPHSQKKVPKSSEFIDSSEEEEEGQPKDDKEKKIPPLLGVKEEVQSFF